MHTVKLDAWNHRHQFWFNPCALLASFKLSFPEAIVDERDQYVLEAKRAEQVLDPSTEAARSVLMTMWRNVGLYGPLFKFEMCDVNGSTITGGMKRLLVSFTSDSQFSAEMKSRIVSFLRSLRPASLAVAMTEEDDNGSRTID